MLNGYSANEARAYICVLTYGSGIKAMMTIFVAETSKSQHDQPSGPLSPD